jgi:hypothetical protein
LTGSRKNPRCDIADIRAGLTERDAGAHRGDVLFEEI